MEGRQHILDGNCDELEKLGPKIEALLLIPLIQGTLYYASKKEGVFGFDDSGNFGKVGSELDTAAAFALAASILPYVDYVDSDAAKVIANIMMSPSCLKMIVIPMVPWCTNRIRIVSQCLIRLLGLHQRWTLLIVHWLVLWMARKTLVYAVTGLKLILLRLSKGQLRSLHPQCIPPHPAWNNN
mmetsp:Transcript_54383/g.63563  ORF Transcript_54383/g.63563 Transcript_54383/m.63563 type:complete len:183 (+) Transcript_54383:1083-1631(+)